MPPKERGRSAEAHARNAERKAARDDKPADTPEAEGSPEVAHQTGGIGTEVEQEGLARDGELDETGYLTETEDVPELSKEDQQAAIASSMGGGDNYPYVDRTQIPVHERSITMNSPLTEASQAELNPAFTAKAEDGGPTVTNPETGEEKGIGSEPNAFEQQADAAENAGGEDARKAVEDAQAEGEKQQMDVDKVNAQAEERTPDNVDASTGQKTS